MNKKKRPGMHIWMLIVSLLFAYSAVTTGLIVRDTPQAAIPVLILAAGFFFLWWKHRNVDLTLLARSPEKKLARLQKVSGDQNLYRIAESSEGAVREEALRRISDRRVFLEKARELDAFALEQITDPEMLFSVATDGNFFPEPDRKENAREYRGCCASLRRQAVDQISDEEYLARLAREGGSVRTYAAEKLLREHPERALPMCTDESLSEDIRTLAGKSLVEQVKSESAVNREKAAAFCRDRTLPVEARLAAAEQISDQSLVV